MVVLALFDGVFLEHTADSQRKHGMSNLAFFDVSIEGFIAVLALDEAHFVWPPLNALPVGLVIFQEHLVVIGILSETENDVFWWGCLRPLHRLEGKHLQSLCNISDCTLFGRLVLEVNASSGGVAVFWHEMDTALGEVHQKHAWVQLLVNEVLQLRLGHVNELDEQGMDLNVNADSLGVDGQQGNLVADGSQIPGVIGEVSSLRLKIGKRRKLACIEHKLSFLLVVVEVLNVVGAPGLAIFIPNSDFVLVVVGDEHVWWKPENNWNGLNLDSRRRIGEWNLSELVVNCKHTAHLPLHHASRGFRIKEEFVQDNAAHADVVELLEVFETRYIIKTGPTVPHYKLRTLLLLGQPTQEIIKLHLPHVLHFSCNVCPHAE